MCVTKKQKNCTWLGDKLDEKGINTDMEDLLSIMTIRPSVDSQVYVLEEVS